MKHRLADLPEPYREVLRTGRAPRAGDEARLGYREQASTAGDPRSAPWRYFAPEPTGGWVDAIVFAVTAPMSIAAVGAMLSGARAVLFEASVRERLWSDVERGRWGLLAFELVLALVLLAGVGSLVVYTLGSASTLWHERQARRDRAAGLGRYGIYLSHDHLLLRRTEDAGHALLLPREQVTHIERIAHRGRGPHPTTTWRTELHVREGEGLVAIILYDHDYELGAGLEAELRGWQERGLASPVEGTSRVSLL